ncbi:MAG: tetratricopeptide repeat protein, partial [Acidobacteriaceae bacterium]
SSPPAPAVAPLTAELRNKKRKLIVRDTVLLVSLALTTVVLVGVTLLLFHSFRRHREELAIRWYTRGETALAQGHPEQAVGALRAALNYAEGNRDYELQLARALAAAGHTEEANAYFTTLWASQPGSGIINLELARLAVKRKEQADAVRDYRAAIDGSWGADAPEKRRAVRMELIQYLLAHQDYTSARTELLILSEDLPSNRGMRQEAAALMEQAGALNSAYRLYMEVLHQTPNNFNVLIGAGRTAYELENYQHARNLLQRALSQHHEVAKANVAQIAQLKTMLQNASRILQLDPSDQLPLRDRVNRVLYARKTAKARLNSCMASASLPGLANAGLVGLSDRWQADAANATATKLMRNPDQLQQEMQLVFDTEQTVNQYCGPATGDDALLLMLSQANEPASAAINPPEQGGQR